MSVAKMMPILNRIDQQQQVTRQDVTDLQAAVGENLDTAEEGRLVALNYQIESGLRTQDASVAQDIYQMASRPADTALKAHRIRTRFSAAGGVLSLAGIGMALAFPPLFIVGIVLSGAAALGSQIGGSIAADAAVKKMPD